jgi:hypothetical protein
LKLYTTEGGREGRGTEGIKGEYGGGSEYNEKEEEGQETARVQK